MRAARRVADANMRRMHAPTPKPSINVWPLPYEEKLPQRPDAQVDLVVIHCTELPDLAMAREYGERVLYDSGAGNSGHYYVDRDGSVHLFVHPGRVAHHCRGYNDRSIGIELVNTGRYPDWFDSRRQEMNEPYPTEQLEALAALLASLRRSLTSLRYIAGHEELDTAMVTASDDRALQVHRKRDPGPLFPWPELLSACGLERLQP
jgi:N-acetylmuramoyl-L-alanine amidase